MSMLSRFATLGGAPTDPYWANVSYLLVGNGANGTTTNIKDSSSNNIATTIFGNTVISTAQSKFGSGSVYFDGSNDYLSLPSTSLLSFGTGDFTLEFWIYVSSLPTTYPMIVAWQTPNQYLGVAKQSPTSYKVAYRLIQNPDSYRESVTVLNTGSWNYIAASKSGSTLNYYINGSLDTTVTETGPMGGSSLVTIGYSSNYPSNYFLDGYIYDLRITKGVARYSGSTMTVPTAALPIG